jgi:hypothetical protein
VIGASAVIAVARSSIGGVFVAATVSAIVGTVSVAIVAISVAAGGAVVRFSAAVSAVVGPGP